MRPIFQVASGFAATFAMFGAGAIFATAILAVEAREEERPALSMDSTGVWTTEPVRVASAAAAPASPATPATPTKVTPIRPAEATAPAEPQDDDQLTTASLPPPLEERPAPAEDPAMIAAHVDWCASRYRSYDPGDNSYRSYSGGLRDCVSPYLEEALAENTVMEADAGNDLANDGLGNDIGGDMIVDERVSYMDGGPAPVEHIQACMSRYRSYDPGDNSYQPYGGGPRMQCEN